MATIGAGGFQPFGVFSTPGFSPAQNLNAPSFAGPCAGPQGLGYNRQMLGDIEEIMLLMALLKAGAGAPCGGGDLGMNPNSLSTAPAKGGGRSLAKAPSKGGGSLKKAPGKPAASLSKVPAKAVR